MVLWVGGREGGREGEREINNREGKGEKEARKERVGEGGRKEGGCKVHAIQPCRTKPIWYI